MKPSFDLPMEPVWRRFREVMDQQSKTAPKGAVFKIVHGCLLPVAEYEVTSHLDHVVLVFARKGGKER